MEQLQRLAETIAETYIRDLKRNNGTNEVFVDGFSGKVEPHLLASGLVDNIIHYAKGKYGEAYDLHAYKHMADLICLDGREYNMTQLGIDVINMLTTNSLKKQSKITTH